MKTLFLVRHAKSSRDDPALSDRERPLNDRGQKDAPMMGQRLAKRHVKPDFIISSPAVRALATAQAIAREIGYELRDIAIDERVYASTADALLAVVQSLDKKADCVMLVGHNPEMAELARCLSGEIPDMPTCAVVEFRYNVKAWRDVGRTTPSKLTLDAPKL
jgi:phosphohistidine phosphatase